MAAAALDAGVELDAGEQQAVVLREAGSKGRWQAYVASRDSEIHAAREPEPVLSEVDIKRQSILNKRLSNMRDTRRDGDVLDGTTGPVPEAADPQTQMRLDVLRRRTDDEMREYELHREHERQQEDLEIQRILERREQRRKELEADEQRLAAIRREVEEQRRVEEQQRRSRQLEMETKKAEKEDRRRTATSVYYGSYLNAPNSKQRAPPQAKSISAASKPADKANSDSQVTLRTNPRGTRLAKTIASFSVHAENSPTVVAPQRQTLLRTAQDADAPDEELRALGPKAVEKFELLADRVPELDVNATTPTEQLIEQLRRLHEEMTLIDSDVAEKAQLYDKQQEQIEQLRKLEKSGLDAFQEENGDSPVASRRVSVPARVSGPVPVPVPDTETVAAVNGNGTSNGTTNGTIQNDQVDGHNKPSRTSTPSKRASGIPRFVALANTASHE